MTLFVSIFRRTNAVFVKATYFGESNVGRYFRYNVFEGRQPQSLEKATPCLTFVRHGTQLGS